MFLFLSLALFFSLSLHLFMTRHDLLNTTHTHTHARTHTHTYIRYRTKGLWHRFLKCQTPTSVLGPSETRKRIEKHIHKHTHTHTHTQTPIETPTQARRHTPTSAHTDTHLCKRTRGRPHTWCNCKWQSDIEIGIDSAGPPLDALCSSFFRHIYVFRHFSRPLLCFYPARRTYQTWPKEHFPAVWGCTNIIPKCIIVHFNKISSLKNWFWMPRSNKWASKSRWFSFLKSEMHGRWYVELTISTLLCFPCNVGATICLALKLAIWILS